MINLFDKNEKEIIENLSKNYKYTHVSVSFSVLVILIFLPAFMIFRLNFVGNYLAFLMNISLIVLIILALLLVTYVMFMFESSSEISDTYDQAASESINNKEIKYETNFLNAF